MKKPVPNYKGDEEKEEQGSGRVMFFEKENRSKEYFAPTYKSKINEFLIFLSINLNPHACRKKLVAQPA